MHIGVVLNSNPSSVRWSILTCSSRSSISNCLLISIYSENLFTIVVRVFVYINWLLRDVVSNTTDSGSVKTSCIMKNRSGITSALLNNCTSFSCNSNDCSLNNGSSRKSSTTAESCNLSCKVDTNSTSRIKSLMCPKETCFLTYESCMEIFIKRESLLFSSNHSFLDNFQQLIVHIGLS